VRKYAHTVYVSHGLPPTVLPPSPAFNPPHLIPPFLFTSLLRYFAPSPSQACAVVGYHGAAAINVLYMCPHALFLEVS
jgi:hypothetical protein